MVRNGGQVGQVGHLARPLDAFPNAKVAENPGKEESDDELPSERALFFKRARLVQRFSSRMVQGGEVNRVELNEWTRRETGSGRMDPYSQNSAADDTESAEKFSSDNLV